MERGGIGSAEDFIGVALCANEEDGFGYGATHEEALVGATVSGTPTRGDQGKVTTGDWKVICYPFTSADAVTT